MEPLQPAQPFKDLLGLLKKLPTALNTELTSDSAPFRGKYPGGEICFLHCSMQINYRKKN